MFNYVVVAGTVSASDDVKMVLVQDWCSQLRILLLLLLQVMMIMIIKRRHFSLM